MHYVDLNHQDIHNLERDLTGSKARILLSRRTTTLKAEGELDDLLEIIQKAKKYGYFDLILYH